MFRITMSNPGGELDSVNAIDGAEAAKKLIAMIEECGELSDGDTFEITDLDS